jgi:hypothetical protein
MSMDKQLAQGINMDANRRISGVVTGSLSIAAATMVLSVSSAAAAPGFRDQNRQTTRYADDQACADTAEGYRCTQVSPSQAFDRKGRFESAEIFLYEEEMNAQYYLYRYASCPTEPDALKINLPGPSASFAATVDTATCTFNFGMRLDFATGEEEFAGFEGVLDVRGIWRGPALRGSSQYTQHEKYNKVQWNYACNTKYGWDYAERSVTVNGVPAVSAKGFVYSDLCNLLDKQ